MVFFRRKDDKLKIGQELVKKGNLEEAEKHFLSSLEGELENNQIRIELARLYFNRGDIPKTKQILSEILVYKPTAYEFKHVLELSNHKKICSEWYFNAHPNVSPDGEKVVFVSARKDTNQDGKIDNLDRGGIYLTNLKTGEEKLLVSDEFYNSFPSFSLNGEKIIYLSTKRDTNGDERIDSFDNPGVYTLDLNTGEEKQAIPDTYKVKYPSFSPIGEMILFLAWRPGARHGGIYFFDLESGREKIIGLDVYDHGRPVFSSDGTKIVYTSWRNDTNNDGVVNFRDNTGIYLYDLEKDREFCLVSDRYNNMFPVFSPDGKNVAYLSFRRDTNRDGIIDTLDNPGIYIYDLETNKESTIVSDEFYNKFPNYSYNGKKLLYIGSWRGRKEEERAFFERKGIYMFDLIGKTEEQIVSDRFYGCRELVSSPASSQVVYTSWKKGTNRGLYLADFEHLPKIDELQQIIEENLRD
ncbi:MAG TPA: hypothetical protein DHV62_04095 [Elusimicrobia bacterium]|jgi:Tol biopolymer transport system component|nr:hypothetical protein [Elusimicrobiota bacterium]